MEPKMLTRLAILTILVAVAISGCSSSREVVGPSSETRIPTAYESHMTWGTWQFVADPVKGTLDVTQARTPDMHINALPFLEPPALVNLTLESLKFNGNIVEADIGLKHPFLGLTEFTGFDVCGVVITNGSVTGFGDTKLRMAGAGDTRLLNPDGYTRWWNPAEFPHGNTMLTYQDGLLGTSDAIADYNSTLNAYKYFCDDLSADDPLSNVTQEKRGLFSAGHKNIRHYSIDMGPSLIFNYAVDACWRFPEGNPPWTAPDDFPPKANRSEARRVAITEVDNTLWSNGSGSGGALSLSIDVYDWFNAGMNTIRVESPGNFDEIESTTITGGGDGYSTYEVEISNATPAAGQIDLLISVISEEENFEGFINGTNTTAYFMYTAKVGGGLPFTGWARTWGGPADWDEGWDVAVDDSGNVYVSGMFAYTCDFDPSDTGTYDRTAKGTFDAFVSKFDPDGNFVWALTWGGNNEDWAKSVAISGNYLYVSGFFRTTVPGEQVDFDPSDSGTEYRVSNGDRDGFISQFDLDGNFNWVQTWGTANYEWGGEDIVCDSSGNVYSLGWNEQPWRIDLRSYNSSGVLQWSYIWPAGAGVVRMEDITIYGSNLYFTGLISGSGIDMDPGDGVTTITTGGGDGIICCLTTSGTFQWVKNWGIGGEMWAQSIACDASGNMYVGGTFTGTDIDFDPWNDHGHEYHSSVDGTANRDCFLTKFDSTGKHVWAKVWGGWGNEDWAKGVNCDSAGNPYVVGGFRSNKVNLDPDGEDYRDNANEMPTGTYDIFLSRFDPTGDYIWGRNIGGGYHDYGNDLVIAGSAIYYTGVFMSSSMDFDPGAGTDIHYTHGGEDVFLSKISTDGTW